MTERDTIAIDWRSWLSLLVAPIVWGARLLASWTVAEMACSGNGSTSSLYLLGQSLITVAALALVVFAGVMAWSAARAREGDDFDPEPAPRFLAYSGVLAAVIFSLLIVAEGSTIYLVGCG
jgi:hypothetical protein